MLKCALFVRMLAIAVRPNVANMVAIIVNAAPNLVVVVLSLVAKWQQHRFLNITS